jgi:hypothetical protein
VRVGWSDWPSENDRVWMTVVVRITLSEQKKKES